MNMNENPTNPADGKFIVVENGQRVTGPLSQQEAKAEAERRNRVHEQQGQENKQPAQVKQNLLG